MDEQRHEWLKVPDVARGLRIARSRVHELVGSGETTSARTCRSVRVSREEPELWLEVRRYPAVR